MVHIIFNVCSFITQRTTAVLRFLFMCLEVLASAPSLGNPVMGGRCIRSVSTSSTVFSTWTLGDLCSIHALVNGSSRCFTKLTRVRVECISDTLRVQPCASGDRFITSVLTVNGVGDNMVSAARRNVSVVSHSSTALAPKWGSSVFTSNQRRSYDARLVRPASQITRSAGRGGVLRPATLLARDPFFGECHNNDSPSISVGCVVQGLRITRLTSTSIHIDVPALSLVSRAYGPIGRPPTW